MAVTKKAASFTIRIDLLKWLKQKAKEDKKKKSAIIEIALEKLREAQMKEDLKETCMRIKHDPEMHELAEAGLQDSLDMIDRHEDGRR